MTNSGFPAIEVPVIETIRLNLRGHRREDFRDCASMWGDPVVTRYIGGRPLSTEEAWTKFLRYIGHWSVMGFGFWAIEEKDSGRFIGELGFADFKRDITPSLGDTLELGWVLASRAHGRGYATEALQAVVAWGKGHLKAERTVCLINPENLASIRVAKKCGFQEFSRAAYKGAPTIIFEHQAKAIPG